MNWKTDFDWDGAIKHHSEALKGIVEALFAMLGLDGDDATERIARRLHRAVLRVLRPAESAVRRLIVAAARGVVGGRMVAARHWRCSASGGSRRACRTETAPVADGSGAR